MKKLKTLICGLAATAMISGCATVDVAKQFNGQKIDVQNEKPIAHINADNWGFYFLSVPLFAGSIEKPGTMEFLGSDTVKVGPVVDLLTSKAKKCKATNTVDITSTSSSTMIPFPIPFLFYIKDVQVSGNAIQK
jgi:hypothetical protein